MASRAASILQGLVALALLAGGAGAGAEGGAAPAASREPLTLELLMQHFASTRGVRAEFEEVKEIALLDAPLISHGVLYFVPPRRFARFVTRPAESSFVIDGARLQFHDETGGESVDLSGDRTARAIVDNMIGLWSGDLPALKQQYAVEFHAEGERWTILLTPLHAPTNQVIERIELEGDASRLSRMELLEKGGDRTLTRFRASEVDRAFSAEDLARIFPQDGAKPRP
jgi:hypothetical protein